MTGPWNLSSAIRADMPNGSLPGSAATRKSAGSAPASDRAYFLELTGAYEMPKDGSYPREIYAQADAPDQYDPSKTATAGEGSIFDEVMGEFNDFEGDDNYDDEY